MDGLRNPHVNKFLPPKRNGEKSKQKQLSFVFDPIVDLNLPDREQYIILFTPAALHTNCHCT